MHSSGDTTVADDATLHDGDMTVNGTQRNGNSAQSNGVNRTNGTIHASGVAHDKRGNERSHVNGAMNSMSERCLRGMYTLT